jgi:hypothetical protein
MDGQRAGNPGKLTNALLDLADLAEPPLRFDDCSDAVEAVENKADCSSPRHTPTVNCRPASPTTTITPTNNQSR